MSKEVPHKPCPYEDCGSSDAFSYNTEGFGKCHSCGSSWPPSRKDSSRGIFDWADKDYPRKKKEEPMEKWYNKEPSKASFKGIRGLDEDVAKLYSIQAQYDEEGELYRYAIKWPLTTQYRKISDEQDGPKYKSKAGANFNDQLGGPDFNAGTAKRLYLTEGAFDAASLYQALGRTFPVKPIPSASVSDSFIKKNHEYLSLFEQIVYAGELDTAGKKAADRLYKAYPEKFYFVPLTKWKDANEALMAGDVEDLKWAAVKPQRYSPDNFFCSEDEFRAILREENPYEAVATGHEGIDSKTRGLVKGGATFIKAPPGTGKSLAPDTPVLTYKGAVVRADEVQEGDLLMGPDSRPRAVTNVNLQKGPMYRITPNKGDSWCCNEDHILSLRHTSTREVKNVLLTDYLGWSDWQKSRYKLYRAVVDFPPYGPREVALSYAVGFYLGDGRESDPELCFGPKKQSCVHYLLDEGIISPTRLSFERGAHYLSFSSKSTLWYTLLGHLNPRKFPSNQKIGHKDNRRFALAGLLDADGSLSCGGIEVTQKSEHLADDICFIARSLGLAAYKTPKKGVIKALNFEGDYFRVFISGDLSILPTKRLKPPVRKMNKDVTNVGFTVESIGEGTYRGIALDGDHLFLLGDFTVTHNTEIIRYFERAMLAHDDVNIAAIHMEEQKSTTLRSMATYELGKNVRTKEDAEFNGVTEEEVENAAIAATKGDRTILFEMRASDDPLQIIEYVSLAARIYGADFVFVDHVQRLTYLAGVDGATNVLTRIASNLAQLCKELNIGVILISHVNEDGSTKYAKALEEEAIITMAISRDKTAEDEHVRNTTKIEVTKNRPFSKLGAAGELYFDTDTTILQELEYDI